MSDDEVGTKDESGAQHEEVVTGLLDLQRRLRGDEDVTADEDTPIEDATPEPGSEPRATPPRRSGTVVVQETDLQVLMTAGADEDRPTGTGAPSPDERWVVPPVTSFPIGSTAPGDAERKVAGLQARLERVEHDVSEVRGSAERLEMDAEAAHAAILDEVSAQRDELRHAIDEGFRRLQEALTRLRTSGPGADDDGTADTD